MQLKKHMLGFALAALGQFGMKAFNLLYHQALIYNRLKTK
jgi:hypothetical protein